MNEGLLRFLAVHNHSNVAMPKGNNTNRILFCYVDLAIIVWEIFSCSAKFRCSANFTFTFFWIEWVSWTISGKGNIGCHWLNLWNRLFWFTADEKNVLGYYRNLGSLRYGNKYCVEYRSLYGKKLFFFSSTEAYFNHAVITACRLVRVGFKNEPMHGGGERDNGYAARHGPPKWEGRLAI